MKQSNMLAKAIFSLVLFCSLGLSTDPDILVTAETMFCSPTSSSVCFHNFDDSTDATTGDSPTFPVSGLRAITYKLHAVTGAQVRIMECPTSTKGSDCTPFVPDTNQDGKITSADEYLVLTGAAGRRGIKNLTPGAPWQYVDVLAPPSSGTARVTVMGTW
jgi:hypothetical protein